MAFCHLLSSVLGRYPGIGIPGLTPGFIPPGVRVFLQSENGMLGQGPYPTPEQVRGPIFHTGTGQGPYIPYLNRSGALYPTLEQVRDPIFHTRTGQGPYIPHRIRSGALFHTGTGQRPYFTPEQVRGPISHTGTCQGSYIPHRNRSGVLYPTPEQVRGPPHTRTGQGPTPHQNRSGALYPTREQVRALYSTLEQVRCAIMPSIIGQKQLLGKVTIHHQIIRKF